MAIHQVRAARRAKRMSLPISHPTQTTAAYGGAKGKSPDLKVPKKATPAMPKIHTAPPKGRALPSRGEHD